MPTPLIAHPFRLSGDGSVQTHEQDTDAYLAERIALLVGTQPGERPLVPAFGINDPAFGGLSLTAVQNQVVIYGIPVTITRMEKYINNDGASTYRVTFERNEETQ